MAKIAAAKAIASPHLAEFGLSLHACMWGLGSILTMGKTLVANETMFHPGETFACAIGILPFIAGIIGMIAVSLRHRAWRMASSIAVIPVWVMLCGLYWSAEPPISGGVVTYGLAAIGEAVVYMRVRMRLDAWADYAMDLVEVKEDARNDLA